MSAIISTNLTKNGPNGLDWHCCLAGSSKTAPGILIFSIAIGADYSYEVKNSEIWAHAFFKHNNSSVATVWIDVTNKIDIPQNLFWVLNATSKQFRPNYCRGV